MKHEQKYGLTKETYTLAWSFFFAVGYSGFVVAAPFWQLTFRYYGTKLELTRAALIPPMLKKIETPGLNQTPLRAYYEVQWLNRNGEMLLSAPVQIPLGARSALGKAPRNQGHELQIPQVSSFVLRLEGPEDPEHVHRITLQKYEEETIEHVPSLPPRLELPSAFWPMRQDFALPQEQLLSESLRLSAGPIGSEKIHDTGPDSNRLVLVVMGDGFTRSQLEAYRAHVRGFLHHFLNTRPWKDLAQTVNIYRVDVLSNESGVDYEDAAPNKGGTPKDTYLEASFWVGENERLMCLVNDGAGKAMAAADQEVGVGVWDQIVVFANASRYGGCGAAVATASVHPDSYQILVHELGHSFADLADEYEGSQTGTCSAPERNVACEDLLPNLKWKVWIDPGTPLPTSETDPAYAQVVGAFEGARYRTTGIYRPMKDCLMRTLFRDYCVVCKEAHFLQMSEKSASLMT